MDGNKLIPHLFRTEYSKMVSVLTKTFGLSNIEVAEDIVGEAFLTAIDTWPYRGIPENPTAWLYTVAKNKFKNHLHRTNIFSKIVSEQVTNTESIDENHLDFSDKHIADSQIQMLFAICHPSISTEAQISLALRILCGLGLDEIAVALLTNKQTIHKRLQRAKQKLHFENIQIELPNDQQINERIDTVVKTIYLLFSEGYYSESNEAIIRKELCIEALNLGYLLLNNPLTNTHTTNALMALMCFQTSRLEARQTASGDLVLYDDQERKYWDKEFIEKGFYYLQQASKWETTSAYYIEASIAYWHTVENSNTYKWPSILKLYDVLLLTSQSPIVYLNRIWAFSKVHGNILAIEEANILDLGTNHFYYILLAELHLKIDTAKSREYLSKSLLHCKTSTEKSLIMKKIESLGVN